jgi:cellulose synthase operon protein C
MSVNIKNIDCKLSASKWVLLGFFVINAPSAFSQAPTFSQAPSSDGLQSVVSESDLSNNELSTITPSIDWPLSQQMHYAEQLLAAQRIDALGAWKSQVEAHTSFERMSPEERKRWRDLRVNYVLAHGLDLEANKQFEPALLSYYNILASSYPHENTVRIAILRASKESGASLKSKHFILQALYQQRDKLTNQELESAVPLLSYYGEQQESEELMVLLSEREDTSSQSMLSMMKIAMDNQQWELANKFAVLAFEKENFSASGILLPDIAFPLDNTEMSSEQPLRSLYRSDNDSLISMQVRDQVDILRARENGYVAVGYQQSSNFGKNEITTIPIEFRIPIMSWNGHLLVRSDYVALKSGDIRYYSSSAETNTAEIDQDQSGWALGLGYQTDNWSIDIGSTPVGFDHEDLVGGFSLNGESHAVEWGVTLSKRPLTASTLAYGGLSVPSASNDIGVEADTLWGSVMRTGVKVDVNYDQGEVNGAWTSVQYHQITGQGVEDNKRTALLGGLYRKLINEENQLLTIGGDVAWLSYENNQDQYSFGLGGYYSPQSYVSVALPIHYYRIIGNDVALFSSMSLAHSWATEDGYLNTNQAKTNSQGVGISGDIGVEHQINGHWLIGAQVQGQFDDRYSAVNVGLYTRYNFKESWQKMDLVPHNLIAYSDFD